MDGSDSNLKLVREEQFVQALRKEEPTRKEDSYRSNGFGIGHFNNRPPEYVRKRLYDACRLVEDENMSNMLRERATYWWFKWAGLALYVRQP